MEKMELYHFHKNGLYDHFWKENKTILVQKNFKSATYQRVMNFNSNIEYEGQSLEYSCYIQLLNQGLVEPICSAIELFQTANKIVERASEFKRENAMENYRVDKKIDVPSRLHSIYLTDEKGIEAWRHKFPTNNLTLYRVEVEGEIFKTSEQLIPRENLNYQDFYDASYNYWHPNFKKVPEDCNEYLAQGKIKVLEKI